jgi:hypothetical protein
MPIQVEVPGQGLVEFPDGMTDDQIANVIRGQSQGNNYLQTAKDFGKGLEGPVKGFIGGSAEIGNNLIGAATFIPRTLLNISQKQRSLITGEKSLSRLGDWDKNRKEANKEFIRDNEAIPGFGLGRVGAHILGSLGAGSAAGTVLKGLSHAPRALQLAEALRTGGFAKDAGILTNMAGGAAASSLGSLLVDPSTAPTSAAVGAALPVAGKLASALGGQTADIIGGMGTQTGGESIKTAARAGYQGGQAAKTFAQNMRGQVPFDDVIGTVKQNLSNMAQQRGAAYRSGMVDIANDKTALDFVGIDDAINNAIGKVSYKGQVKNQRGADVLQAIRSEVDNWKSLDPAQYHTPEGMDALKQKIGGILESIPFEERTANAVGKDIYNAVKSEINKQAPTYASVMKDYAQASEQLDEVQKALLGGNRATADSAMRKLQSLMRNNVNTNYGNRLQLAKALEQQGGNEIMPALAGQSMSSLTPRGLGNVVAGATAIGGPATLGLGTIPALAVQSPRLVGETSLKAGQIARLLRGPAGMVPLSTAGLAANQ